MPSWVKSKIFKSLFFMGIGMGGALINHLTIKNTVIDWFLVLMFFIGSLLLSLGMDQARKQMIEDFDVCSSKK